MLPTLLTSAGFPLLFGMPGLPELLIILVVVLVLFGNRIPGLARTLGSGITEFKKGLADGETPRKDGEGSGSAAGKDDGKTP